MPSRTVRYWHKVDDYTYEPLACSRTSLRIEMKARDLEWCPACRAAVEPEGKLEAAGLYNTCPFCNTRTRGRK